MPDKRVVTQVNRLMKTLPDTRVVLAIIHKLHIALTRFTIAPATLTQQLCPGPVRTTLALVPRSPDNSSMATRQVHPP